MGGGGACPRTPLEARALRVLDCPAPATFIWGLTTLKSLENTALHAKENHHFVLLFARKIDFYLRKSFFTGNWSSVSLQEAVEKLKGEKALFFYWRELLQSLNVSKALISISCDVLSAFVRKFTK